MSSKKTSGDGGGGITADSLTGGPPATGSGARAVKTPECGAEGAAAGAPAAASASDLLPIGAAGAGGSATCLGGHLC
jgi:hypothetical protein